MKVVEIKHLTTTIKFDPKCDCIDVVAYFENGDKQVFEVCTASYLPRYMEENNMQYLPKEHNLILVDELVNGSLLTAIDHILSLDSHEQKGGYK